MTQLTRLFTPGQMGTMQVRNRICMAPMGVSPADADGFITDWAIRFFAGRARGGVGLIIVGAVSPVEQARAPYRAWIWDDRFIPRLRDLADAVHREGAKIALQLLHHSMALSEPRNRFDPTVPRELKAPSARRFARTDMVPRELTRQEIDGLVEGFSEAARRTRDAGCDAVEFHGAHQYLINAFFSPFSNRRTDEYGGSPENRARFACEILQRSRQKVGPDFPLLFRLNGDEYLEGGLVLDDVLRYAPLLVEAGADVLHVTATCFESSVGSSPTFLQPEATFVPLAAAVKSVVDVPVITVGRLSNPFLAEQVLEEGKADFISLGRALLADPAWPQKVMGGRYDDVCRCIYCNNCLAQRKDQGIHGIACTVNPPLMREDEFEVTPVASPKRVMVVGGGIAGMEAARVLAERGHRVALYERDSALGGQWRIACQQEDKEKDFSPLLARLLKGLKRAEVEVNLNTKVTAQLVRDVNPDTVVLATGAIPSTPDVPGVSERHVVQALDVIIGKAAVGQTVVVIGGRERGMEIADYLSRKGRRVYLATRSRLGRDVERNIYQTLRDRLLAQGVTIFEHAPLLEILPTGVHLIHNRSVLFVKADTVVLATGAQPENGLATELRGAVPELYSIGDCVEPRNALMAIREAAEAARRI